MNGPMLKQSSRFWKTVILKLNFMSEWAHVTNSRIVISDLTVMYKWAVFFGADCHIWINCFCLNISWSNRQSFLTDSFTWMDCRVKQRVILEWGLSCSFLYEQPCLSEQFWLNSLLSLYKMCWIDSHCLNGLFCLNR